MSRGAHSALAAALALLLAAPAAAEVPPDKQALITLRVLAYDHALAGRAGDVRLAVVHGDGAAGLACAGRMHAAFTRLVGRVVVNGKRLAVETLTAAEVTGAALVQRKFSVLYVCGGSDGALPAIVKAARSAHVLTFTDQLSYLARGLSIALTQDETRVAISVNLVAARAEGARLAGQLLRLSKVVTR